MSAFIVSHDLIDALLTYGIEHSVQFWRVDLQRTVSITPFNATKIGQRLLNENAKSVEHRYPQDAGSNRVDAATYEFRPFEGGVTHAQAARAGECFDYNSSEHPGWHTSRAFRIVSAIRIEASKSLPGYVDAPWAIERPRTAVAAVAPVADTVEAGTEAARVLADLGRFTGSETYYRHGLLRAIRYSEGAHYVAETAGAHWLLDIIASAQLEPRVVSEEFQVWELVVTGTAGTVTGTDGNNRTLYTQQIEFTDFPDGGIKFFFANATIYLPSEH